MWVMGLASIPALKATTPDGPGSLSGTGFDRYHDLVVVVNQVLARVKRCRRPGCCRSSCRHRGCRPGGC